MLLLAQRVESRLKVSFGRRVIPEHGDHPTWKYVVVAVLGLVFQRQSTIPRLGGAYRLQVLGVRQKHTHMYTHKRQHWFHI